MIKRIYIYCPSCGAEMEYDGELRLICPVCDIKYSYTTTANTIKNITYIY